MSNWTIKEIEFLKANFKKLGGAKVARKLDRPKSTVYTTYYKMQRNKFKIPDRVKTRKLFDPPALSKFQLGYVAGFIDGEGSLILSINWKKDNTPRRCGYIVMITQNDQRPLKFIHEALRVSWEIFHYTNKRRQRHYYLSFAGQLRVEKLLTLITPHLILKKEQAEIMLQLMKQHKFGHWTLDDWKLVLKHAEANKMATRQDVLKKTAKLKRFIEQLEHKERERALTAR